ncbi:unnamed protein product [Orchesella dallaii]|uniref:Uncharacterized protein n=1 Tax=Orchesella dallaii TaxID=48710 RepID=A0ABP1Q8J8_9HEXA
MGVYVANKVLSGFSAILSLSLTAVCIWTLISLIEDGRQRSIKEKCNNPNITQEYKNSECEHLVVASAQGPTLEDEHQSNFHEAIVIESKKNEPTSVSPKSSELFGDFDDMNPTFRLTALICVSGTICASLMQFICSIIIIFSPPFRVAARSRKIVGILFVTFILYLVAFGWPLACMRSRDNAGNQWHTMTTLNSSIKDFFMKFSWGQLCRDLNLFYLDLFINTIFLFLNMVITCCLLRWAEYEDYDV